MTGTPRLALPYLSSGQSQKEVTVNEGLQILDFVVAGAVAEPPRNDPPSSAEIGDCYIVGPAPTGAWSGWANALAGFSAGGWRRVLPVRGMSAQIQSTGETACYRSSGWEIGTLRGSRVVIEGEQVIGARADAISSPTGGTVVDLEARDRIGLILAALREHGLIAS